MRQRIASINDAPIAEGEGNIAGRLDVGWTINQPERTQPLSSAVQCLVSRNGLFVDEPVGRKLSVAEARFLRAAFHISLCA
jgi:hypothetical protein